MFTKMTPIKHTTFLCVLLGAFCIRSITSRPQSIPYALDDSKGSLISTDVDSEFDSSPPTDFNDNLYVQLLRNNAFRRFFKKPYHADEVNRLLSCVANKLTQEFQIDTNSALNTFYSSLKNIYTGSTAEVYASTVADALSEILSNLNTLSGDTGFNVANRVSNIFDRCVVSYVDTNYMNNDYLDSDILANPNIKTSLKSTDILGTGIAAVVDAGLGSKTINVLGDEGTSFGLRSGLGNRGGAGLRVRGRVDTKAGPGPRAKIEDDARAKIEDIFGARTGIGTGSISRAVIGAGVETGAVTGIGSNIGKLGAKDGLKAGVETRGILGARAGIGANLEATLRDESGAGIEAGMKAGKGPVAGISSGADIGTGIRNGASIGAETLSVIGSNIGGGPGSSLGSGLIAGVGAGGTLGAELNSGAKIGTTFRAVLGTGDNLVPVNGANLGLGLNFEAGIEPIVEQGAGICSNAGMDVSAVGTLDPDTAMALFRDGLTKELLKNRYFRLVFSESVPEAAVSNIASAIAQFLSKAFKLPRSYLFSLERDLTTYMKRDLESPNKYAESISISFLNLLTAANLMVPSAICIQIGMASKAITSGLLNFLGTNKVAGVGLGLSRNPYNSYFSILSGLEMLPYVGPDAVSQKFPPILKAIRATNFGTQFTQTLLSNLISSNTFSSSFVLGIPSPIWNNVARCLGNSMAEAFGSVNPAFFIDVYSNALLSIRGKISFKTYARILSAATAKALYALGYFVSGNPNIQAAIAANAIIKITVNRCIFRYNSPFPTLTTNLGVSWMTPIAGVFAPQENLDVKSNVGVGVGTDLEVDLESEIGANLDVDLAQDAQVDLNDGLRNEEGVVRRRRDLPDYQPSLQKVPIGKENIVAAVEAKAALPEIADAEVVIPATIDAGFEADADLKAGYLQAGLGANADVGTGLNTNINAVKQDDIVIPSILDVLPRMLAEKLFTSTALYTAMSLVGPSKVANLIGQAIAAQFGIPIAAVFSNTYDNSIVKILKSNSSPPTVAIARATTEALANAGVLANDFNILLVDQLSSAIVAKYSSLIATSLDTKEWNFGPRWSYIYDEDFIAPPLSRGYNYWRPNTFLSYLGSYDDRLALDYGIGNYFTQNVPLNSIHQLEAKFF